MCLGSNFQKLKLEKQGHHRNSYAKASRDDGCALLCRNLDTDVNIEKCLVQMEAEVKWFMMSQGIPVVSRKPQKVGGRLQWTPFLTASQKLRLPA